MQTTDRYPRVMLALLLVLALLVMCAGRIGAAPKFQCEDRAWVVGDRIHEWRGDTGGTGSGLPPGYVAVVSSDTVARTFTLFLYDGGDTLVTVRYDDLQAEPGTQFPTGRFDPQGLPVVLYHDNGDGTGMVKIFIRAWNGGGGGPAPLLRIYTWCGLRE